MSSSHLFVVVRVVDPVVVVVHAAVARAAPVRRLQRFVRVPRAAVDDCDGDAFTLGRIPCCVSGNLV